MDYYKILRPFLYGVSPEVGHNLAILALKMGMLPAAKAVEIPSLKNNVFGIDFDGPVGLAAGFDKNADVVAPLLQQGFDFVEVGTVTPKAQYGNAKPRLFRLLEDGAVINRFGFNNKGYEHFLNNVKDKNFSGIVGINIGKNKITEKAVDDYLFLLRKLYGNSDYITINISSPNTPGLRNLQSKQELDDLLGVIMPERDRLAKSNKKIPILVKISPDTDSVQREEIAEVVIVHKVDGLIVSNTTSVGREPLKSRYAQEVGGLSGRPLFAPSTAMLADMYRLVGKEIPIVGVGGIFSGDDAYKKIRAGAALIQVYSALVYEGFGLINNIKYRIAELLERDGFSNINEAIGADFR